MKVVVQNPHLLSDNSTSGINDWGVEFLRLYRPAIRIHPLSQLPYWFRFLQRKQLPYFGWTYVLTAEQLGRYDIWMCWRGSNYAGEEDIPARFPGAKLYHVIDYSYRADEAIAAFRRGKVDRLLGYARHDQWCEFFRAAYPGYQDRVIPVPFGYARRFENRLAFERRDRKCSVMGAVNMVRDQKMDPARLRAYIDHFSDLTWAHPMRQAIRENLDTISDTVASYLATWPESKNLAYDSVEALNRYQLFLNDDSIMHYPPARTFEGVACGAVMVCSDHPCFDDFGWQHGVNCLRHRFADLADFRTVTSQGLADQQELAAIQARSLDRADHFSHVEVARGLHLMLEQLLAGKDDEIPTFWRRWGHATA